MEPETRYARAEDEPQLRELWRLCFGEENGFMEYFFTTLYKPENAVVTCIGGEPVCMIHCLPRHVAFHGYALPVYYIYGVATHPEHRGKRLAIDLMEYVFFQMHLLRVPLALLIPQSGPLFDYYARQGYVPVFHLPEFRPLTGVVREATEEDIPYLAKTYRESLKDTTHVIREESDWKTIFYETSQFGGKIYITEDGYKVGAEQEGKLVTMEDMPVFFPEGQPTYPFGCLRVVEPWMLWDCAGRNLEDMPALYDPNCVWNGDDRSALPIWDFTTEMFGENTPYMSYMNLMHN